jgi:DNA segregation ATPase FtsK/SpoIIIE, S-DNA-T family
MMDISTPNQSNKALSKSRRLIYQYGILLCLTIFVVLLPSLLTYHPSDLAWSSAEINDSNYFNNGNQFDITPKIIHNLVGSLGAYIADILLSFVGYSAYWFVVLALVVARDMWRRAHLNQEILKTMNLFDWVETFTFFILIFSSSIFEAGMLNIKGDELPKGKGGIIGQSFIPYFIEYLGFSVSTLLLFGIIFLSISWFMGFSWLTICEKIGLYAHAWWSKNLQREKKYLKQQSITLAGKSSPHQNPSTPQFNQPYHKQRSIENDIIQAFDLNDMQNRLPVNQIANNSLMLNDLTDEKSKELLLQPIHKPKLEAYASIIPKKIFANLPKLDVWIDEPPPAISEESLKLYSKIIEHRLKGFGVMADVVGVTAGPVLTLYEIKLPAGTKVNQLMNVQKDIARELGVIYLNIIPNIPQKTTVGFELSNQDRQLIRMRPLVLGMLAYPALLPVCLGVAPNGQAIYGDLTKMLHILIAGTTGSGKSICVHSLICSLLAKMLPQDLRLVLIDPKMIELSAYRHIPHLLTPIITEVSQAQKILDWLTQEMDERYRQMSELMVRNIQAYNHKIQDSAWLKSNQIEKTNKMPYIVVVIDELSDFMLLAGKQIEMNIVRLAQKARAAGIHLILATQRPTADVITGLIKANIPTRIALQVPSKLDSRIILDQAGAEHLLGKGDMLYDGISNLSPQHQLQRIHGIYLDDGEIYAMTDFWRRQGEPNYIDLEFEAPLN